MNRIAIALAALMVLIGGFFQAALADDFTAEELVLMKLFGTDPITTDMFAPGFLNQVSMAQVLAVFGKSRATVGAPTGIEQTGPHNYVVHTSGYDVPVDIGLDRSGRIAALLIHPLAATFASIADVFGAIDGLRGDVSYLVTRDNQVLYARGQTRPLAVGSAFKLGVLAAVEDAVGTHRIGWDSVVRLRTDEVSLPTGQVQLMPVGAPLTVHTLAAFMISQSDNTATDMLIDLVGRDAVARRLGLPFVLKTGEFFRLKADPALRLRYGAADAAARQNMTEDIARLPLPDAADTAAPLDPGIEWYLPASRLCALAGTVADLDVFTINKGVARPDQWAHIAFKGGSEVGVANLTTDLVDRSGHHYCVTLTQNDRQALDEQRLTQLYAALIGKLAG